jgi:3-hydroxyacyl-CoA dehydrogenase/enoyl-CoA hydratase/3-hydroxybutyryl-CoA epimerase
MTGAETTTEKQHVLIRKRNSGVAFVFFDSPGKVNLLTATAMDAFDEAVTQMERDPDIKALAILSGKPDTFILGADLHEIIKLEEASHGTALAVRGQKMLNRLSQVKKPSVAGINGMCLGGGLELALACDRRIATNSATTNLGLPEVRLGFVPGLGGTQRLPRLIGAKAAVQMILAAEPVDAQRAKELGLVDEIVSPDDLLDAVEAMCLELIKAGKPEPINKAAEELSLEKLKNFFAMSERAVRIRTKGKYPAQTRVLNVIQKGLSEGLDAGLEEEAKTFGELCITDVSRNLVFLFFTTEFVRQSALGLFAKIGGGKLSTIGIVGGGTMGRALAEISALSGLDVIVKTIHEERQQLVVDQIKERVARVEGLKHEKGKVIGATGFESLGDADIIVEACVEDEQVKAGVFEQIARIAKSNCVIATNTSSLSIGALAQHLPEERRKSFVGLHFFNPVDKMPLVELIGHSGTTRESVARASGFVCKVNKVPVSIKDSPSFLVNRLVSSYLGQSSRLALLDFPLNWTEDAAIDFGMPMGPYALADEIGLDIALECAQSLHGVFGSHMAPPPFLTQMISLGLRGRKSGSGIYKWEDDKKAGFSPILLAGVNCHTNDEKPTQAQKDELAELLVLPMIDESCRCLEERVVRRPREIDLCVVLGMAFPAFRGGLLRYADALGPQTVIDKLEKIYERSKWDVQISTHLKKLASEGRGFYTRGSGDE